MNKVANYFDPVFTTAIYNENNEMQKYQLKLAEIVGVLQQDPTSRLSYLPKGLTKHIIKPMLVHSRLIGQVPGEIKKTEDKIFKKTETTFLKNLQKDHMEMHLCKNEIVLCRKGDYYRNHEIYHLFQNKIYFNSAFRQSPKVSIFEMGFNGDVFTAWKNKITKHNLQGNHLKINDTKLLENDVLEITMCHDYCFAASGKEIITLNLNLELVGSIKIPENHSFKSNLVVDEKNKFIYCFLDCNNFTCESKIAKFDFVKFLDFVNLFEGPLYEDYHSILKIDETGNFLIFRKRELKLYNSQDWSLLRSANVGHKATSCQIDENGKIYLLDIKGKMAIHIYE